MHMPRSTAPLSASASESSLVFEPLAYEQLASRAGLDTQWFLQGYLAAGNVTLLTSQWKAGKTTLLAVLLSKWRQGGQLAGLDVRPARAFVVSEESPAHWHRRGQ